MYNCIGPSTPEIQCQKDMLIKSTSIFYIENHLSSDSFFSGEGIDKVSAITCQLAIIHYLLNIAWNA